LLPKILAERISRAARRTQTLKTKPAVDAGDTDHVWTIDERLAPMPDPKVGAL